MDTLLSTDTDLRACVRHFARAAREMRLAFRDGYAVARVLAPAAVAPSVLVFGAFVLFAGTV